MRILDIQSIQAPDRVLFQVRLTSLVGPQNVQVQPAQLWSYGVFRKAVREQTGEDYECFHLGKATDSTKHSKLWRDFVQELLDGGVSAERVRSREQKARRGKHETREMVAFVEVPSVNTKLKSDSTGK